MGLIQAFIATLSSAGSQNAGPIGEDDDGLWHDAIYFEADNGLWNDEIYFDGDDGLWHDEIYF